MRIEVLTSLYPSPPRPLEGIFAERRWEGMARRGHQVRITHPLPRTPGILARGAWAEIHRMPAQETRSGLSIERPRYLHLPKRARRNARRFAATGLKRILVRDPAPEVVVCDYAWPAAEAAPLLREAGIPCVISGRGSDVLQVAGEAGLGDELARCLRASRGWLAVSQDLVDAMDALEGSGREGVLVPNGVDLAAFPVADLGLEQRSARQALGLDPTGPLVLVVGHLIERKDPLLALQVAAKSRPDVSWAFLGRGPLDAALRSKTEELGLTSRIRFEGEVEPSGLSTWFRAADALLLTSKREGRPNVVLEALASGRGVVATEAGGTAELLQPWLDSSLCRTRDPEALWRMLLAQLDEPLEPQALRASVEPLSWEASLSTLERVLGDAVEASVPSKR